MCCPLEELKERPDSKIPANAVNYDFSGLDLEQQQLVLIMKVVHHAKLML